MMSPDHLGRALLELCIQGGLKAPGVWGGAPCVGEEVRGEPADGQGLAGQGLKLRQLKVDWRDDRVVVERVEDVVAPCLEGISVAAGVDEPR